MFTVYIPSFRICFSTLSFCLSLSVCCMLYAVLCLLCSTSQTNIHITYFFTLHIFLLLSLRLPFSVVFFLSWFHLRDIQRLVCITERTHVCHLSIIRQWSFCKCNDIIYIFERGRERERGREGEEDEKNTSIRNVSVCAVSEAIYCQQ